MQKFELKDFTGGWVIGNFLPNIIKSDQFEVAIKHYKANDYEHSHFHNIATEITIIVNGRVRMNNDIFNTNDIILINPNEITDFFCFEDTTTCVIKVPSVTNDKYLL